MFVGDWDHVVLMVGANDLGYVNEDESMTDIHAILALLQDYNPEATVHVCEVLPRKCWTRQDVPSTRHPNYHAKLFNKYLHRDYPERVIDLYQHFVGNDGEVLGHLYKKDGLHPTSQSGFIFRNAIMRHIRLKADPGYYHAMTNPQYYEAEAERAVTATPVTPPFEALQEMSEGHRDLEPEYLGATLSGAPLPGKKCSLIRDT